MLSCFSRSIAAIACLSGMAASATAQNFVNGDFETGNLDGWTVVNTPNGVGAPGTAVMYDIDGPGPLEPSYAARFVVGMAVFQSGSEGGIEMTQTLDVTSGTTYTISFDWAVQRESTVNNADGGRFYIIADGVVVGTALAGGTTGTTPIYGRLSAEWTPVVTGPVPIGVRITRAFTSPGNLFQYVDNLLIEGGSGGCYPNCDGSSVEPILNIDDFTCFINEFAAAQNLPPEQQVTSYANCDGSTIVPVLNIDDFTCFINSFAQGCE